MVYSVTVMWCTQSVYRISVKSHTVMNVRRCICFNVNRHGCCYENITA